MSGSWWMSKNSQGRRDALLTFSLWAVAAALAKFLLNGVVLNFTLRGSPVNITTGVVDAVLIGSVLIPTLGTYTAKRLRGGKNDAPVSPTEKPAP